MEETYHTHNNKANVNTATILFLSIFITSCISIILIKSMLHNAVPSHSQGLPLLYQQPTAPSSQQIKNSVKDLHKSSILSLIKIKQYLSRQLDIPP